MGSEQTFDSWPKRYDQWFETPIGRLVREYESAVLEELLCPAPGERILDAGCGTGVFTSDLLSAGLKVVGLDISLPMLLGASQRGKGTPFFPVAGDLLQLPFADAVFRKTLSMTTLEFISDGKRAVQELFRVTRSGGSVVVSTLNSLSPWAERRKAKAAQGDPFFQKMTFRSPGELDDLAPVKGRLRTAVHFQKSDEPKRARKLEEEGQRQGLMTGAFLAVAWRKV